MTLHDWEYHEPIIDPHGSLWSLAEIIRETAGAKVQESVEKRLDKIDALRSIMDSGAGVEAAAYNLTQHSLLMDLQSFYLDGTLKASPTDIELLTEKLCVVLMRSPLSLPYREPELCIKQAALTRRYQEMSEKRHKQWQEAREKCLELTELLADIYSADDDPDYGVLHTRRDLLFPGYPDPQQMKNESFALTLWEPLRRVRFFIENRASQPFRKVNYPRDRTLITEAIWPVLCDLGLSKSAASRIIADALVQIGMDSEPANESIRVTISNM